MYQQLKKWGVGEDVVASSRSSWIPIVIALGAVACAAAYWTYGRTTAAKAKPPARPKPGRRRNEPHPDSPHLAKAAKAQLKTKAPRPKDSRKLRRERKAANARLRAEEEAEEAEEREEEVKRAERKNRLLQAQLADEEAQRSASTGTRSSGNKPTRTPSKSLGTKKKVGGVATDEACAWCGIRDVQLKRCLGL